MRTLAFSVHPDDETLGCGGTLLKHKNEGDELFWVVVTEAKTSGWSKELIQQKAKEVEKVAKAYQMTDVFKLGFPTTQLDTIPQSDLITSLREIIAKIKPETVYMVHSGDVHTDHHAVFSAAFSVFKSFYTQKWGVKQILSFETLSSTEAAPQLVGRVFVPNVYSDITPYLEKKIEIMNLYETEAQKDPMPRGPSAIRALARYRGATVGVEYAEAFMLLRKFF